MTSLLLDDRRGAQLPQYQHLPLGRVSSAGQEAIDLAESVGLILDPWQRWVLDHALAERADGQWAAFECALIVPRQNGKGAILEALELAGLFLFGERLIVHSAHKFDTAQEHFLRVQALIDGSADLSRKVAKIFTANGKEAIILTDGARLKFVARSRGAARGFSGDRIVLDEAYDLPAQAIGAMLPALSARPNPQVWYTSSAPQVDSHVLHGVCKRGRSGNAGRLFYAEWGNEPGVDPLSLQARSQANPARGIRITDEFMDNEYAAMQHLGDEFARERLGVPSSEDNGAGVFGPGRWAACADDQSTISGVPFVALDVAPGMAFSSFAVAGSRADGLHHAELAQKPRPGTGWVVAEAVRYATAYGRPIALDPKGPAGGLIDDLEEARVPLLKMPDGEMPRACVTLQKSVQAGTFRHRGQRQLDDAVAGAAIRVVGDAWRWTRAASSIDISPLVAVTVASWAAQQAAQPVELIVI